MRILDLFCGAGGAAMGYHRAFPDAEIVGVDNRPQPNYPFEFVQADAMTYPLDGFDFIHASPPCQAFTSLKVMANARRHDDLLTGTRGRLKANGAPWAIENVPGAPMSGVMLCGSMFGLHDGIYELRRHRLFETSFPLPAMRCAHRLPVVGFYGNHARRRQRTVNGHPDHGQPDIPSSERMKLVDALMGINWMTWSEANQAIPPAYTQYIGKYIPVRESR